MKVKVLVSKSSAASSLHGKVTKALDSLIAKNSGAYDITDTNIKVADYPQQTSTAGESTVQLTVTLTLGRKAGIQGKAQLAKPSKPVKSDAALAREDKERIMSRLPSEDWYYKYDASKEAEKITKTEYAKLKASICNGAVGRQAVNLAQAGYHFQNFLTSDLHSYEVFYPKSKHSGFKKLPMIFAITNKVSKRTQYFKANRDALKLIHVTPKDD